MGYVVGPPRSPNEPQGGKRRQKKAGAAWERIPRRLHQLLVRLSVKSCDTYPLAAPSSRLRFVSGLQCQSGGGGPPRENTSHLMAASIKSAEIRGITGAPDGGERLVVARLITMKLRADQTGNRGLPMPLWLQGGLEAAQAAFISAIVVILPLVGVWATDGFQDRAVDTLARLGGQAWLLIHGVPLELAHVNVGTGAAQPGSGLLSLVPLGLTLIPFLLAWRAGRRLARASYTDQLWQAFMGAFVV